MKSKRVLAMILSVVMVATSGNFTLSVHATEDADDKSVVIADVDSVSDAAIGDGNDYAGEEMQGDSNLYGTGDAGDEIIDENTYFVVDGNGVLKVKEGVSLGKTVSLPAKAKIIPKGIFDGNKNTTTLTIPAASQLTTIEAGAFERSGVTALDFPKTMTVIGEGAFKSSNLATISFASGIELKRIGKEAFEGSKLTNITFPSSVKEIGESAFKSCTALTMVNFESVEVIGVEAFMGCKKLNNVGWKTSLREIQDGAFADCGLTSVDLNRVSGSIIWGTGVFAECTSLTSVMINANMQVIPAEMFRDCTGLEKITLDESAICTRIEREAFYGCVKLTAVSIPAKVNTIESNAFGMCKELATITINQKGDSGVSTIVLAEDAFPRRDAVTTMRGYDGTVETYAGQRGYKFESLVEGWDIKVASGISNGSVTVSPKNAKPGETVEVTVKPNSGYRLRAKSFYYLGDKDHNPVDITKLVSETAAETPADGETAAAAATQVFSFVMPNQKVTIYAEFIKTSIDYGTLSVESFEPISDDDDYVYWDEKADTNGIAYFGRVGTAARLVIKSNKIDYTPGSWEYTYSSSSNKIAVIDSEGVIYARGVGTATITAKLKNASNTVKFKVNVAAAIDDPESVKLELEFSGLSPAMQLIDEGGVTVIQYTKADLATRAREFQVNLKATLGESSTNMYLPSTWKSYNTSLAYPGETTVWDNANTLHVKSGVSGETTITVTATNGLTDKNKVVYGEEQTFIIRVIDTTPRLVQSSLTVNALSSAGTEFDLIPVYGYAVDPKSLHIQEDVKSGTVKEYQDCAYFAVESADGSKCYLQLTDEGDDKLQEKGKDISYSNKLYIVGSFINGGTFRIPIKSVVVTNKALKPTVKLSGKLNLFFNNKASDAEAGKVVVTQSLKDLRVAEYELVSEANYKQAGSEAEDSLANNFVVDENGVITRSDNELKVDAKGKPITKGYLKITYVGYDKAPCYVKITIPVETKKPNYALSVTKATVHTNSVGYAVPLQILDKKTKKVIPLDDSTQISFDDSAAGLTSDSFDTERDGDEIKLVIKRVQKGKAIINVQMETWNEPLKFTFNLSVSSKLPTVKAKSSTLTLNNVYVGRETYTEFTVSQKDVELIGMSEPEFKGKGDEPAIDIDFSDGKLTAVAHGEVKKGSYKYTMTPQLSYMDNSSENAKPITITVKVVETKLTMAMKSKTLTLNRRFAGDETAQTTYTIKNLPAGEEAIITQGANFKIEGANNASMGKESSFDFRFETDSLNTADQCIAVSLNQKVSAGTYKFKVTGLETGIDGRGVEIQPFTFSVKVVDKDPKFSIKTSGTLNPCNAESQITYKFTVSNLNARITDINDVSVKELDSSNGSNEMVELQNFEVVDYVTDTNGYITGVIIGTKEGVELDAKRAYKLKIGVQVSETTGFDYSAALAVKFKQTLPKIKADVTSATVYAGADSNSSGRSQDILITKTTETGAEIDKVVLAGSNSDAIMQAFDVAFDETTQKATIKLVRPAMLKANTQYNVKLEVKVKGQLANTTGPTFTVKVKVLN